MEDWFVEDGVTNLVCYRDVDTEQQWKAFETFSNGTFEEFKKAILASYPKARECKPVRMTGTLKGIGKNDNQDIL